MANKPQWIWFPGDREVWLGNQFNNRRTERGAMFPPFWKQDSHWQTVEFSKEFTLPESDTLHIHVEGIYNFMVDGKLQFGQPDTWTLPAGRHKLNIKVNSVSTPPSLWIEGTLANSPANTDGSWLVTCEDKIWIDENGVAHGSGIYLTPGMWPGCDDPQVLPSQFQLLRTEPRNAIGHKKIAANATLWDFGRETMGYVTLHDAHGEVALYYGESEAEALDKEHCETLDRVVADGTLTISGSKAFRYVLVEGVVADVTMLYEYLPQDESRSGRFECSDDEVNRIWQVAAYTMDLTTREFMMDGIKRDRWTWSGDAIQSYLMNYYLRFDSEAVKRTIRQLRGKDPVTAHVNTILDYTFYWFNSLADYYRYTGDAAFIAEMYPRAKTLMDYTLGRLSDDGLAIGQPDDWVFVDWVDFPMHKRGILSFEQMLLIRSLRTMQMCAALVGDTEADRYATLADDVQQKTDQLFWDDTQKAYLHALEAPHPTSPRGGESSASTLTLNRQVTKFPNMMAILYGVADADRALEILANVMQNPDVPAITTPYMRFYELAALCQLGLQADVLPEIKAYWGGMLRNGATSFWEKYVPEDEASANEKNVGFMADGIVPSPKAPHLEMYGRPYGKSLCHAWGASPIYLIGRYFLGIEPLQPGYISADGKAAWTARPTLGGLAWMRGNVPTPFGPIHIEMDENKLIVTAPKGIGRGEIRVAGKLATIEAGQTVTLI
ncbi:MAG: alpha-rhamnosidase [Bacteroidales bacterium]|nr:alpha-rhamnosidase [Bacteroidales bacterium]